MHFLIIYINTSFFSIKNDWNSHYIALANQLKTTTINRVNQHIILYGESIMLSFSRVFLSLVFISNFLALSGLPIPSKDLTPQLTSPSETIDPKEIKTGLDQQAKSPKKNGFSEDEVAEMEMVFESSPKDAQNIVNHLQDPNFYNDKSYRSAYFVGEPGCGKTTMAKAIAYKMAKEGWGYKIISSTQLMRPERNSTAMQLEKELDAVASSNKPILIVIDELNRLLENADSKHHDTDSTATALWSFLDREFENENIFLIGTMNRIDKLPKPFKNRISPDYIKFFPINDPDKQQKTLRTYFSRLKLELDPEITDTFLIQEFEKMGPCAGRNLKKICRTTSKIQKRQQDGPIAPIKKLSIKAAINEVIARDEEMGYNKPEETDEERQERYHNESKNLQVVGLVIQGVQATVQIAQAIITIYR